MYGCQQILINPNKELKAILTFICEESNNLYNTGVFTARQAYFKDRKILSKFDLINELKENNHYQALFSQVAQQTLITVGEAFQSFLGLLKGVKKGTITQKPKLPNYRKSGGLNVVSYPSQHIKNTSHGLRFPLGTKVKIWFKLAEFYLPMPTNLKFDEIKEYRILPRNGKFYLELIYKMEDSILNLDPNNALGIDPGLNNWLTCVSNVGTSFLIDGRHLKSVNQWYNKTVAKLKTGKPQGFWSNRLANITEKRNRQMRDAINKAARIVVNHCIENNIGTIVFGWNKGVKDSINLGSNTNQKFVQIPTSKLKDRIEQLCQQYGIRFIETEESYTSQASFLDNDLLPKFGEKPEQWQAKGKRVKRGLYRSADGTKINADCNGAANILRKVAVKLGLNLSGISRGVLTSPFRIHFWIAKESPSL